MMIRPFDARRPILPSASRNPTGACGFFGAQESGLDFNRVEAAELEPLLKGGAAPDPEFNFLKN